MSSTSAIHRLKDDAVGFVVGAVIGVAGALYGVHSAKAAVAVRPELANVGFITAFLTNHPQDWLFYHYPAISGIVFFIVAVLVGGFGTRWMTR